MTGSVLGSVHALFDASVPPTVGVLSRRSLANGCDMGKCVSAPSSANGTLRVRAERGLVQLVALPS